jgi:ABC-type Fe3+-siderophore transport system permease subunit
MRLPFHRKFDEVFRGERSTWLKAVCGVIVAVYITGSVFLRQEKRGDRATYWRVAIIGVVFAAVAGGLIAFMLQMKDRVKQKMAKGERVNPLARAYLGWGIWSLLLWCPTIFFLGIATICSIAVVGNILKH